MKNMLKSITMSLVVVSLLGCGNSETALDETARLKPERPTAPTSIYAKLKVGWLDLINQDSSFILAMPYATNDNFLKEKIYPCKKCLLREDAGKALLKAQQEALKKGYSIVLLDCYRPLSMQQKMFDILPDTKYVGDPKRGSKHNKGVAVDISLADKNGKPLDMGAEFDDFTDKARYDYEDISAQAKQNRKLLRDIMLANDFRPYNNEWWHFNYKKTDYPNEDWVWDCDE